MKDKAGQIGLVLGIVFIIMGFAYSNTGVWMLGFVFLAIGGYDIYRKKKSKPE